MRLANTLRRNRQVEGLPGVVGVARLDRRTKRLTTRLRPGEIAIVDHVDIDRVSADALVACGAAAVVNAAPSISGRYPNLGPEILMAAGVPLLDSVGTEVFGMVEEGEVVRVHDGALYRGEQFLVAGDEQNAETVGAAMAEARAGLATQLEAFAANTMEYLLKERDLLLDGVGVPDISTQLDGRHVLIVVRGYDYREDLAVLRSYIREYRPVLLGVDGGADALLEAGYAPDLIVGDMDSVSDRALRSGAEIVVHAYETGHAPGAARLDELGLDYQTVRASAISEDIALLLAYEKGAELIVAVGTHFNLIEFLERNRAGMSSTFLTRLKVGEILIDAKGVSRLVDRRVGLWPLLTVAVAGLAAIVVAVLVSPALREVIELLARDVGDLIGV